MENKCHEVLEQKMCKELEMIQAKYQQNPSQQMTEKDVEMIDKLYHALKCMATYKAMKESDEYENDDGWESADGVSGRRGRSAITGRYVSRDGGNSYADGYSRGYSEAMNQMNDGHSGHYPMPPYYPARRY